MGWKKWGAALLLCVALTGCGGQEVSGAVDAETGEQSLESETQQQEQPGESDQTDGQEDDGDMNMDYADYFKNLKLTTSYKGLDDANPLMTQRFGADPYAMEYDGRVYFYMTADAFEYEGGEIKDNTYGKIHQINVISPLRTW